jgi:hypothetical protein
MDGGKMIERHLFCNLLAEFAERVKNFSKANGPT